MSEEEFVKSLGSIYEDTPEIAAQAWRSHPFSDLSHLHQAMAAIVLSMDEAAQLRLICAHPDLGSKFKMAEASVLEQSTLGLDQLSAVEFHQFQELNQAYKDKFGFPFIIAVRNHTKDSILQSFQRRLQNAIEVEQKQAIAEINEIARWRLTLAIKSD
ncbi:MAG: OHCU decarboxylase [Pseudanabaena sp.]|nr:MAG: OHCU decarboxylase [Pseudanabaena sp.]